MSVWHKVHLPNNNRVAHNHIPTLKMKKRNKPIFISTISRLTNEGKQSRIQTCSWAFPALCLSWQTKKTTGSDKANKGLSWGRLFFQCAVQIDVSVVGTASWTAMTSIFLNVFLTECSFWPLTQGLMQPRLALITLGSWGWPGSHRAPGSTSQPLASLAPTCILSLSSSWRHLAASRSRLHNNTILYKQHLGKEFHEVSTLQSPQTWMMGTNVTNEHCIHD